MFKLSREEVSNKIYTCWIGKNNGGTLGGPFEGTVEAEFVVKAGETVEAKNKLVAEISCDGQHETIYVPVVFLG